MGSKKVKLLKVKANGQINIGKSWAGRHILVEEVGNNEIRILSGKFVLDSQNSLYTELAQDSLEVFNKWEGKMPAKATNTKALFSSLKKKK